MMDGEIDSDHTMQSEIFIMLTIVVTMLLIFTLSQFYQRTKELTQANERILQLREMLRRRHRPTFELREAEYSFERGSAVLGDEFEARIGEIVSLIEKKAASCDCDVVEVYGHTDGEGFDRRLEIVSTLDVDLLPSLEAGNPGRVRAASNVELGILRSAALVDRLLRAKAEGRLEGIKYVRPYSAGQAVLPDGSLARADAVGREPARRRIELRISRSTGDDEPVPIDAWEEIKPIEPR